MEITAAIARKVLDTVDAGLVHGLGSQVPGKMCVEAAVCFALGLPHDDNPPCVGDAVRGYKIRLNDSAWSSDEARTTGMRKLALAQLGSNEIDQVAFAKHVALGSINRMLPAMLREVAKRFSGEQLVKIEAAITACETAIDLVQGKAAAANAAANAAADAANAAADAAHAMDAAANDAADAAYAAANAAYAKRDEILTIGAEVCLEALRACGSPGVKWLREFGLE